MRHPKTNEWLILLPGDEPDEDLAEIITNPDAWGDDAEKGDEDTGREPDAGGTSPEPVPPPVSGPEPVPTPEPLPEAEPAPEPVKAARSKARKATVEQ